MEIIMWVLVALILLSSFASAFFSFRARRAQDGRLRGLYAARMNMSMGAMLILIAVIQMFMFSGSTLRVIIGAVFMLLGLFNLFAGFRNHGLYSRMG